MTSTSVSGCFSYLYWRFYVNCKIFRRQHKNGENPKCVIASDYFDVAAALDCDILNFPYHIVRA